MKAGTQKGETMKGRSIYDLIDEIKAERDAALARVAELEAQDADRLATIARLAQELFDTRQERDALRRAQGEK
jgi:sirohydrochlorin ferrochelatase